MNGLAAMMDWSRMATGGLLAAVWQGFLLAVVVWVGLRMLPKTPAAVRFAIWLAVFVVVAGLPVASLWPHSESVVRAGGRGTWLTLDARWSLAIAAVWATASLVRAGTLVLAALRVRTLWKRATPVDRVETSGLHPTLHENAVKDGAPAGLGEVLRTRRAQICTSDEVDRPTVIGFFAPRILIPTWLLKKLTAAELQQIVLHETGHLSRADDWMNLLQKIALVVFPLNPALAWVERRLCFERELACDERVLRTTQAPKAYAACLATLAEHRMGRRGLALALGALGRESELGRRVGRILRRGETMRPVHAKLVLGGAMLGLLGGAVGLERVPQLVGFAASADQAAAVGASMRMGSRVRRQDGYGYQAVVFHPDAVGVREGETARRPGLVADRANAGSSVCANTPRCAIKLREEGAPDSKDGATNSQDGATNPEHSQPRFMAIERRIAPRDESVKRAQRFVATPTVQWVLVTTAWQGEDGSRLVFTTARRSSGSLGARIFSDVEDSSSDRADVDGSDVQQSEEVYPYAAVPVRGGWLVFQL